MRWWVEGRVWCLRAAVSGGAWPWTLVPSQQLLLGCLVPMHRGEQASE